MSRALFFDLQDAADKATELQRSVERFNDRTSSEGTYKRQLDDFSAMPGAQFSYSLPSALLRRVARGETLARLGLQARQGFGAATRFHRLRWEVPAHALGFGKTWADLAHGTQPVSFYKPTTHVVKWLNAGEEAKANVVHRYPYLNGNYGFKIQSEEQYGVLGLTYGKRTSRFTSQILPAGHVFSHEGTAIHLETSSSAPHDSLLRALALLNTTVVAAWLNRTCAQHKVYNYVNGIPWLNELPSEFAPLSIKGWSLQRRLDQYREVSTAFIYPALLGVVGRTLAERARAWTDLAGELKASLDRLTQEIDERARVAYGLSEDEFAALQQSLHRASPEIQEDEGEEVEGGDSDEPTLEVEPGPMVVSLLSWVAGVAFGRFSIQVATGTRPLPSDPDPFDPLPPCSPGMLTGDDGLPVVAPPPSYPLKFPSDGILVDDPGHPRDLVKAVRDVFEALFDDANACWHEAAELVIARRGDLRDWFARTFFTEHVKRYSKGRRKGPILWQLATASASYSVWVYIHRATPDTLFRVLNDFVSPKVDHEREKLETMTRDAGPNPSRADRDALAAQEAFVDELQALRGEIARVAPLWNPDLDDGVILNFAPLWRLVPHERSWQTECRKAWDKLAAAEYDWAHLAMHLWPERVVPKCAEDRSLAIAHGLEDVFWRQDGSGNWHAVEVPEAKVRKLIADRTSTTVKAALKDLLTAPAPSGKSGGRKPKGAPARAPAPRRPSETVENATDVDESTLEAVRAAIAAVPDGASKADVQAATGLSDADWNRAIAALLERGTVTRSGQKRGTRYHVGGA